MPSTLFQLISNALKIEVKSEQIIFNPYSKIKCGYMYIYLNIRADTDTCMVLSFNFSYPNSNIYRMKFMLFTIVIRLIL